MAVRAFSPAANEIIRDAFVLLMYTELYLQQCMDSRVWCLPAGKCGQTSESGDGSPAIEHRRPNPLGRV